MEKILIIGVSGLTGYKIAKAANLKYDVYGTYNDRQVKLPNCIINKLDLTNQTELKKLFSDVKPDIVINTTALHNVDYCEENSEQAILVNTKAVSYLYESVERYGAKLVHISTDYVFDGKKTIPYTEKDLPNPVSIYANSKLQGEKFLQNSDHIILRPSVIYGWTPLELAGSVSSSGKPMNFALWLLTKLNKNESLKIVTDQYASATLADSLAESVLKIAEADGSGLYHVAGLSCESRYEFSQKLAKEFGYDTNLIQPTDSSQFKQKAERPSYSCLNCEKAIEQFGLNLLTTEHALKIMKEQVVREAPHFIKK